MEQLSMTVHPGQDSFSDLTNTELLSTSTASGHDEEWQQPPLLPSVGRPVSRRLRPNERQRQIGLAAIAQARAALAEAARRRDSSHPHAA